MLHDFSYKQVATRTPPKTGGELGCKSCFLLDTHHVTGIFSQVLAVIEERKHLHKKINTHCHLRYGYFVRSTKLRRLLNFGSDDFNLGAT
jgi:hypothetical protein